MGGDNNREVVALVGLLLLCTTDKLKLKQKTNKWIRIISKKGKEQQRGNNSKSSQAVELTGTPFVGGWSGNSLQRGDTKSREEDEEGDHYLFRH